MRGLLLVHTPVFCSKRDSDGYWTLVLVVPLHQFKLLYFGEPTQAAAHRPN